VVKVKQAGLIFLAMGIICWKLF